MFIMIQAIDFLHFFLNIFHVNCGSHGPFTVTFFDDAFEHI